MASSRLLAGAATLSLLANSVPASALDVPGADNKNAPATKIVKVGLDKSTELTCISAAVGTYSELTVTPTAGAFGIKVSTADPIHVVATDGARAIDKFKGGKEVATGNVASVFPAEATNINVPARHTASGWAATTDISATNPDGTKFGATDITKTPGNVAILNVFYGKGFNDVAAACQGVLAASATTKLGKGGIIDRGLKVAGGNFVGDFKTTVTLGQQSFSGVKAKVFSGAPDSFANAANATLGGIKPTDALLAEPKAKAAPAHPVKKKRTADATIQFGNNPAMPFTTGYTLG